MTEADVCVWRVIKGHNLVKRTEIANESREVMNLSDTDELM